MTDLLPWPALGPDIDQCPICEHPEHAASDVRCLWWDADGECACQVCPDCRGYGYLDDIDDEVPCRTCRTNGQF